MLGGSPTPSPPQVEVRGAERKRATAPQSQSQKKTAMRKQSEKKSQSQNTKGKTNVTSSQKRSPAAVAESQPTNKKERTSTYPELLKRLESVAHTKESINKNFTARELQILIEPHSSDVPSSRSKDRCVNVVLQLINEHIIECKQNDCIPSPIALPVSLTDLI